MSISSGKQVIPGPTVNSRLVNPRLCQEMMLNVGVKFVDLRPIKSDSGSFHLPGAVRLDYARLNRKAGFAEGMLPQMEQISSLLQELGINPGDFVVAYDANNGISATRFLWMLDVIGHTEHALLDGGYGAWESAGLPVVPVSEVPEHGVYPVEKFGNALATKEFVLESINHPDRIIVDVRTFDEYTGDDERAMRGGRIPGSLHYEWISAFNQEEGRFRGSEKIESELLSGGITRDKEIIVYCQSNRRSANTYIILKWLGYPRVRAYTGSWSEWGNDDSLPVETGIPG
jgi:thiosulfate/3-mercaptopyruvate sulfurtransferase